MMMLQSVSGQVGNSGDGAATSVAHDDGGGGCEVGGVGSVTGGFGEEGERNSGGNRWPRQETMALLKIRSDMDVTFRDSSLKGPLWEEVARKLSQLGYHRSAKKCKEKFENVYKYHKRTKEGRTSKPIGKSYRFFDQLEALESQSSPRPPLSFPPLPIRSQDPTAATTMAGSTNTNPPIVPQVTVSSINNFIIVSQNNVTSPLPPLQSQPNPSNYQQRSGLVSSDPNTVVSSSTSSDEEPPEKRRRRKTKWKDFFGRMMREVIEKQEQLQMNFLETLEKKERDRMMREEAWRVQEMAKMNREHELLVQERSAAAAKDAAVIQFLQTVTEQQNLNINANTQIQVSPPPPPPLPPKLRQSPPPPPPPLLQPPPPLPAPITDNGGGNLVPPSPSRWPKAEIQALIKLRTSLDMKYQEGPKGPLWEEISAAMRRLGFNRNAKRCKEKWENINKYYKKVKESNKKRPEDAKTCPYFHQLEAIYRERAMVDGSINHGFARKDDMPVRPIMARPEQQWPIAEEQDLAVSAMEDHGGENNEQNLEEDTGDDEDEEDGGDAYEIVTNKPSSMGTVQ